MKLLEARRQLWVERERTWALWLNRAAARPALVALLVVVSWLGDGPLWYALIAALPWWGGPQGPACAWRMMLAGTLNLVLYRWLKSRVARPRPFIGCPGIRACARSLDEYSFPSGHVMHAVGFSLLLGAAYPQFAVAAWAFTALVALSRVVLGLHYPSDVAFGAALGIAGAGVVLAVV
jgi:undecaprenyl-diphosphatase